MSGLITIDTEPYTSISIHLFGKTLKLCLCHHLPERSIKFFGIEKYLCARCFGVLCGTIVGVILLIIYPLSLIPCLILILPMIIDGILQGITKYTSKNPIRFITGVMYGIGLTNLLRLIFFWIISIVS